MWEITVDATTDNLTEVLAFTEEVIEELGCPMKAQMQITVAVEEIFVNIANYAYGDETGEATVRIDRTEEKEGVAVVFTDGGMPFDPLEKADPDVSLPADERQIGGLGIYMVKKSMDDIRYRYIDGKNELTLVKYF